MNGPDHYRQAQKLSAQTDAGVADYQSDAEDVIATGIAALTHAVLALTAATLDSADATPMHPMENVAEWRIAREDDRR